MRSLKFARLVVLSAPVVLALACGDDGGGTATATAGMTGTTMTPPTTSGPGETVGETTSLPTTTGSGSDSASEGTSSTGVSSSTGDTTAGLKFDLGPQPDGGIPGGCESGGVEFSYIWISNSPDGTVSKIDTKTRLEVARYVTGPELYPDPSRTSVNLRGDVAIVNRTGSITKILARPEDCPDTNGNGVVDTSTGAADVRPWGMDECVTWNTPLLPASRPAAWTTGTATVDAMGCTVYEDPDVWTGAPTGGGDVNIYLLDGEGGQVLGMATLPGVDGGLGVYGGAVDVSNDFWGASYSMGPLVHVRHADLSFEIIPVPDPENSFFTVYGFTVDHAGRPWVGGQGTLQRYDPETQTWTNASLPDSYTSLSRGMQEDAAGHLWVAALPEGVLRVDTDTAAFVDLIGVDKMPLLSYPAGISVDVDGFVWMVDTGANGAHVIDPATYDVQFVGGLSAPYTYSDMTGWALKNVSGNPQG